MWAAEKLGYDQIVRKERLKDALAKAGLMLDEGEGVLWSVATQSDGHAAYRVTSSRMSSYLRESLSVEASQVLC